VALITSPEYALKKVVAAGVPCVYEFARVFRDGEPIDAWHAHDFTLLEFYRSPCTFAQGIAETMGLIAAVARAWHGGKAQALVHGRTIPLEPQDWEVLTVSQAFERYAGVGCPPNPSREWYQGVLTSLGQAWQESDTVSDLFQRVFFAVVQPALDAADHPIIISHYPSHEASLAKLDAHGYAERFEAYIGGIELCNAYGELTNGMEQRRRFLAEAEERARLGKTAFPVDEELCAALSTIHEPLFGNAIGWDRLVAVVSGAPSVASTQLFPLHGLPKPDTFRPTHS
jgi:lysyl-tRNA synthetase class 2